MNKRGGVSIAETLVAAAVTAVLIAILFPVLAETKSKITNKPNLQKISAAAIAYGNDYDDYIPILANGNYRSLQNVRDDQLTQYNERRTDLWPLILLPYVKDRETYMDPRRDDVHHIWDRGPHASSDPGYDPMGSSYRNQNRYPFFGVNYVFLSPLRADSQNAYLTTAEAKSFSQAKDPAHTIFYVPSMQGYVPTDESGSTSIKDYTRGFFAVTAPGMWDLSAKNIYQMFWNGAPCSGDWCGDAKTYVDPRNRMTNFAYIERVSGGNNVAFLDGHVKFMKDTDMTAGTNYLSAKPRGENGAAGAVVTDKAKYLWNLDDNFYGVY